MIAERRDQENHHIGIMSRWRNGSFEQFVAHLFSVLEICVIQKPSTAFRSR